MAKKKPVYVWFAHDHADGYLIAAAHQLARAATNPVTAPLPAPSVSATLYCAFAAEAYVNVALLRLVGEEEYAPISRMPVRSKYFLVTRLGLKEAWFESGEAVLEGLDELFTQRNRLVHAQPERFVLHPESHAPPPDLHTDLRNVARWLAFTVDAVARLGSSHAELGEFLRVAGPLRDLAPLLMKFDPDEHGIELEGAVRTLIRQLLIDEEQDFLDEEALGELVDEQDPDWDLRGLDGGDRR